MRYILVIRSLASEVFKTANNLFHYFAVSLTNFRNVTRKKLIYLPQKNVVAG